MLASVTEIRSLSGSRCAAWGSRPDGQLILATGGYGGTTWLWDPDTRNLLRTLSGHTLPVNSVAWGYRPDGQPLLASGSSDDTVRIWNPDTGQLLHTLNGHAKSVLSVAWECQPHGQPRLATVGPDGSVRIWSADGTQFTDQMLTPDVGNLSTVRWAPIADGRIVLAIESTDGWYLWDGVTSRQLYAEARDFRGTGYDNLDWAVDPGGRLLLAAPIAGRRVQIWEVVLDPPVTPPLAPSSIRRLPRERVQPPIAKPVTILDPPEDVTPGFSRVPVGVSRGISRVACTLSADGELLAAVADTNPELQIWNLSTGVLLRTITHPGTIWSVSWWNGADGRPLLATGGEDSRIWDPASGQLLHTLNGHRGATVCCTAWGFRPDGRPMLATGGVDRTVLIWDAETGELLRRLTGHTDGVYSAAWGYRPDGPPMLATGSFDKTARIWDADTGESVHVLTGHTNFVQSVLWSMGADRQPLLVTGSTDGTARLWDPASGQHVRTIASRPASIRTLGWARLPDGRQLLATAGAGDPEVWDLETGLRLASVPGSIDCRQGFALVSDSAGELLLVVANSTGSGGPVRVWRIATGGPAADAEGTARDLGASAVTGAGLSRELLRLGRSGLWPPLGLLADLVTLTGPETFDPARSGGARGANPADVAAEPNRRPVVRAEAALCDARLAALAVEPGLARLRSVGWEPAARVSMAALLASSLAIPEQFTPPPGVSAPTLRDALAGAVAGPGSATGWHAPLGDLRAAAAEITDRTITLLRILGPAACAADPLLPARLAHRIPELPVLTPRELRLLTSAETGVAATGRETAAGTLRYSPGTAGLARTGPLTRLLPTQLALPRDLLTIRLAENQLLYRQHRAPAPPAPEPVTIILDTSPPTYGPAGNTLRLAAHLLAAALWAHDRCPSLITLTDPAAVTELRAPADLIGIWAGATLEDPAAAVAAARATAVGTGQPVVFASHFRTARDCGYRPGPTARLLTAHHNPRAAATAGQRLARPPAAQPRPVPARRRHRTAAHPARRERQLTCPPTRTHPIEILIVPRPTSSASGRP